MVNTSIIIEYPSSKGKGKGPILTQNLIDKVLCDDDGCNAHVKLLYGLKVPIDDYYTDLKNTYQRLSRDSRKTRRRKRRNINCRTRRKH